MLEDLFRYYIVKDAFTDYNGHLRHESSEGTIRSLIAGDHRLRDLLDFAKHVEQCHITGLAEQKTEDVRPVEKQIPLHLIGRFERTGISSAIISQSNDGITIDVAVRVTQSTRIECDAEVLDRAHAIIHKGKKPTLRAVISDELFQVINGYCDCNEDQVKIAEEFLRLSPREQKTLKHVLCSRKTIRSTLFFLIYLACRSANGCNLSSNISMVEAAVNEFNDYHAAVLKCGPICLEDIHCILNLDAIKIQDILLPCQGPRGWSANYFKCFLIVCGILFKLSPWIYPGKSIAQVLNDKLPSSYIRTISEYLPNLCERDDYQSIMDEILEKSKPQSYCLSNMEDMLFEALTVFPFEQSFVNKAIDILFEDSIGEYQVTAIKRLITGPNAYAASKRVFEQFTRRFYEGEAAFHFAAASILNVRAIEKGIDPLEDAVESAMLPMGGDDLLLGITRVSVIAWSSLGKRNQPVNKAALSPCFVQILLDNVKNFEKRYFPISASALHDLILAQLISQDLLCDPAIYQTTVQALTDKDGKAWGERLLALIPWDSNRQVPSVAAELCAEYLDRMERAFINKDEALEPEIMFSVLENLGWWKNRVLDKFAAYQKLIQFHRYNSDVTQLKRMKLLNAQLEKEAHL